MKAPHEAPSGTSIHLWNRGAELQRTADMGQSMRLQRSRLWPRLLAGMLVSGAYALLVVTLAQEAGHTAFVWLMGALLLVLMLCVRVEWLPLRARRLWRRLTDPRMPPLNDVDRIKITSVLVFPGLIAGILPLHALLLLGASGTSVLVVFFILSSSGTLLLHRSVMRTWPRGFDTRCRACRARLRNLREPVCPSCGERL